MLSSDYLLQPHSIFLFWFIYSIICIPIIYFIHLILPSRLRLKPLPLLAFFYLLSISIIFFGVILSLLIALFLRFQKPFEEKTQPWSDVVYPDYQHPPVSSGLNYGEGSGLKIIRTQHLSKSFRQGMLVAINQFESKNVNKINSLALSDDMDEVRLYAQSLIEKQERDISQLIKKFTTNLMDTKDKRIAAYYQKQIAELLWEQVYNYLVANESLTATLHNIKIKAKEALKELPEDMELPLLLTKVALQEDNLNEAKSWLKVAAQNGAPQYKILVMQAELDYLAKDYSKIKETLSPCQNQGLIGIQPLLSYWVKDDYR